MYRLRKGLVQNSLAGYFASRVFIIMILSMIQATHMRNILESYRLHLQIYSWKEKM